MNNHYIWLFVINPLVCILILWVLCKVVFSQLLLKQITAESMGKMLKKLLPVNQIVEGLVPLGQELQLSVNESIPGFAKFFCRRWYREVSEITEGLGNVDKLQELVKTVIDEINLSEIIRQNAEKQNPGVVCKLLDSAFPTSVIITAGIIMGTIISLLQLVILKA
ncbi:MAG: hypothetical protein WC614_13450 [bacterium]